MRIEQKINYHLNNYPRIKKVMKSLYQHVMYSLSPKIKSEGNITRISPDNNHEYFFGYYDKSPWDITDRYTLCMRANDTWSDVSPKEKADILLIDTSLPEDDDNRVKKIAETSSWNVQQACMLQWLGPDYSSKIIYNDYREDKYVAVILEIATGKEKIIPFPVYTVSADGKMALSLDFSRLYNLRPGYGYYNVPEATKDIPLPDSSAVWKIDLETGEVTYLLTYKDFATFKPRSEMQESGVVHKVNHLMLSPNGERCMVLYRWFVGQRKYTRLITFNTLDGSDMYLLSDDDMVSHCFWKDDEHILAFENKSDGGPGYYLMKDKSQEYIHCWPMLRNDGHPSYSPDRKHIVTDSYPDRARIQYLRVMKNENSKPEVMAKLLSPFKYDNDTRCDLHPRWNHAGDKVCFDSVFEGHRGLYMVEVEAKGRCKSQNGHPSFSIITPMYNSYSLMQRYFDSMQRQTCQDFELILIDDCSSDETYRLVREKIASINVRAKLLKCDKNGGAGNARNMGIKEACGRYVLFVDSDDYVSETMIESLSKAPDKDIIFFDYYRTDGKTNIYKRTIQVANDNMTKEMALLRSTTSVCGKAIKKVVIDTACIKFPSLTRYEDWVFMIKAICNSSSYIILHEGLYYYYNNPYSVVHSSPQKAYEYSIKAFDLIEPDVNKVSHNISEALFAREVLYVAAKELSSKDRMLTKETLDYLEKRFPRWHMSEYVSSFSFPQRLILHLLHRKQYALLMMICKVA